MTHEPGSEGPRSISSRLYSQLEAVGRMGRMVDGGDARFGQILGFDRDLHALFPFLLPRIGDDPIIVGGEGLVVGELHGADQVFAEERFSHGAVGAERPIGMGPATPARAFFSAFQTEMAGAPMDAVLPSGARRPRARPRKGRRLRRWRVLVLLGATAGPHGSRAAGVRASQAGDSSGGDGRQSMAGWAELARLHGGGESPAQSRGRTRI